MVFIKTLIVAIEGIYAPNTKKKPDIQCQALISIR